MGKFIKFIFFILFSDLLFSMAAEKWVKFFEVKHYNVINYLMAMKANGYTIVGAEQTAFDQELHKTELPKNMVLVLG